MEKPLVQNIKKAIFEPKNDIIEEKEQNSIKLNLLEL